MGKIDLDDEENGGSTDGRKMCGTDELVEM
jgi:hypothetical protein